MNNTELKDKSGKTSTGAQPYPKVDNGGVHPPKCNTCGEPLVAANLGKSGKSLKCKECGVV
jgi:hypothetical protein